jgi:ethanolamine utilization protein EutQ
VGWQDMGLDGRRAEVKTLIGPEHSDSLAAGLCRFEQTTFPWHLGYDECIHVLEGSIEARVGGETLRAGVGDVMFLPRGSDVTYVIEESCLLYFVTYPVDWQERAAP